jgi:hypothetical protein
MGILIHAGANVGKNVATQNKAATKLSNQVDIIDIFFFGDEEIDPLLMKDSRRGINVRMRSRL